MRTAIVRKALTWLLVACVVLVTWAGWRGCQLSDAIEAAESGRARADSALAVARDSLRGALARSDTLLAAQDSVAAVADSARDAAVQASGRHSRALSELRRVTAGVTGADALLGAVEAEFAAALAAKDREVEAHRTNASRLAIRLTELVAESRAFEVRADSALLARDVLIDLWRREARGLRLFGLPVGCVAGAGGAVGYGGAAAGVAIVCGVRLGG